jgi:hypothetical protein
MAKPTSIEKFLSHSGAVATRMPAAVTDKNKLECISNPFDMVD